MDFVTQSIKMNIKLVISLVLRPKNMNKAIQAAFKKVVAAEHRWWYLLFHILVSGGNLQTS